ncbi:MAG: aminotransferase class V-fold PLP-dependent enzyme, partial [Acidobacteria bacterium]|nr:aminotransferase class V-fold PLP-dependent enzyme [Acidobacteriota bacterium]
MRDFSKAALDAEFPSRLHGIQLNHAAVAPLPRCAVNALAGYAEACSLRGGLEWAAWGREAAALRERAARLVGAGGADSIGIVPNTSLGLTFVAQGFPWEAGDVVVTTDAEFPANLNPWLALASRGVSVVKIPTQDAAYTLSDVRTACEGRRVRVLCVSAVSFHTGFVAPLAELGAFCAERDIVFGVDGIQAVGAMPFDVEAAQIRFLSADGHKWMLGPEGCGILYTHPDLRGRLAPPAGWLNVDDPFGFAMSASPSWRTDGRRFEAGALPGPGVYALAATLELLLDTGLDVVSARIREVVDVLAEGLASRGFTPLPFGPVRSG